MKAYDSSNVHLTAAPSVSPDHGIPVALTDATMLERRKKVLARMAEEGFDALVLYADLEHGSNFEYLTGFLTRFEEGLLILRQSGKATLVLGNENVKMAAFSRIPAEVIHCPFFSLPNQPMEHGQDLETVFRAAGLRDGMCVGVVGWKLFTGRLGDNTKRFDLPHYIIEGMEHVVGRDYLLNATFLFIGEMGVRSTNNANEIAHYEFGSALASDCVLQTIKRLEPGISELELASTMNLYGQKPSVVTICSTGTRYEKANLYPSAKRVRVGDAISLTTGYKGGLASRAAYAAADARELPEKSMDYLERLAAPYFTAIVAWLENMRVGVSGGDIYRLVECVLPSGEYGWTLNPGHLTADEEWMASPIYENSRELLRSGMLLQADIIPRKPGYAGVGCENGIALADLELRTAIEREYPELWERITRRRAYLKTVIGIDLPDEVLPLSSGVAYYTPYLLDKEKILTYVGGGPQDR